MRKHPKRRFTSKHFTKLCARCHKVSIPKGRPIYCGSQRRGTGCSYLMGLERFRKWRKNHPEQTKKEEKWRNKVGYYKRKKVIVDRRSRQRKYYKLKVKSVQ